MNHNSQNAVGGGRFLSLLTVLFIGLKLTHYVSWSWWVVLSPIWFPPLLVMVVFFVIFGLIMLFNN